MVLTYCHVSFNLDRCKVRYCRLDYSENELWLCNQQVERSINYPKNPKLCVYSEYGTWHVLATRSRELQYKPNFRCKEEVAEVKSEEKPEKRPFFKKVFRSFDTIPHWKLQNFLRSCLWSSLHWLSLYVSENSWGFHTWRVRLEKTLNSLPLVKIEAGKGHFSKRFSKWSEDCIFEKICFDVWKRWNRKWGTSKLLEVWSFEKEAGKRGSKSIMTDLLITYVNFMQANHLVLRGNHARCRCEYTSVWTVGQSSENQQHVRQWSASLTFMETLVRTTVVFACRRTILASENGQVKSCNFFRRHASTFAFLLHVLSFMSSASLHWILWVSCRLGLVPHTDLSNVLILDEQLIWTITTEHVELKLKLLISSKKMNSAAFETQKQLIEPFGLVFA